MLMTLLAWILFGFVIGILGYILDPHTTKGGVIGAAILGVAGAIFGGFAGSLLFDETLRTIHGNIFMIAGASAMFLLLLGRAITKKT
jgi:uncharacterized membrane protein YeaQ/YmgE (transglycosylase-associated protein family)